MFLIQLFLIEAYVIQSESFKNLIKKRGATHHLNTVGLPRGNGQVERYNRTVLDSLATMGADVDDDHWDYNICNVQIGINATNKAIEVSPSKTLMRYRLIKILPSK